MKISLVLVILTFIFLCPTVGKAEEERDVYLTELELAKKSISEALLKGFSDFPLKPVEEIGLKNSKEDSRDWILENCLAKMLIKKGYRTIRQKNGLSNNPRYTISYRIADLKIEHRKQTSMFGENSIKRMFLANCFLKLIENKTGTTIWAKWIRALKYDSIPLKYEEVTKNKAFSERVIIEDKNRWKEPLMVLGVLGSMLYLLL